METSELIRKVRKIEIKTKGLSQQIFSGEYHSAFKGRGMAFSEVREYQPGDDIRTIDWNVTARFNHPFVKVFQEERELTVMLVVDLSASGSFGTHLRIKQELVTELCAVLAFSAIQNNDKVGVIFFTDKVEKFIPPKKGKSHILRIIRELIEFRPKGTKTKISEGLKFLNSVIKKRCTTFLISDFFDADYSDALKIANKKHDIVSLSIYDPRDLHLPDIGLIKVRDAETNEIVFADTSDKDVRNAYETYAKKRQKNIHENFRKTGVDSAFICTNESYVTPLMNLFKRRGAKK